MFINTLSVVHTYSCSYKIMNSWYIFLSKCCMNCQDGTGQIVYLFIRLIRLTILCATILGGSQNIKREKCNKNYPNEMKFSFSQFLDSSHSTPMPEETAVLKGLPKIYVYMKNQVLFFGSWWKLFQYLF